MFRLDQTAEHRALIDAVRNNSMIDVRNSVSNLFEGKLEIRFRSGVFRDRDPDTIWRIVNSALKQGWFDRLTVEICHSIGKAISFTDISNSSGFWVSDEYEIVGDCVFIESLFYAS